MIVEYNNELIEFNLVKRKRKTICIRIESDGNITVITPLRISKESINAVVKDKGSWILQKKMEVVNRSSEKINREIKEGNTFRYLGEEYPLHIIYDDNLKKIKVELKDVDGSRAFIIYSNTYDTEKMKLQLEKWYRARTLEIVKEKIALYEDNFKDKVTDVRVKEQKKRWASCTGKNAILFNWRCSMAPENVIEYIVVHEMCHLDFKNHSKDFWNRVAEILPDYKEKHEYLRNNGMNLSL